MNGKVNRMAAASLWEPAQDMILLNDLRSRLPIPGAVKDVLFSDHEAAGRRLSGRTTD